MLSRSDAIAPGSPWKALRPALSAGLVSISCLAALAAITPRSLQAAVPHHAPAEPAAMSSLLAQPDLSLDALAAALGSGHALHPAPGLQLATHLRPVPPPEPPPSDSSLSGAAYWPAKSVSGLSWRSGANCHVPQFDAWRGRPSDVYIDFSGRADFPTVLKLVTNGHFKRRYAGKPGRFSLGLAMLTNDKRGRFDECNAGNFDSYFTAMGRSLVEQGLGDAIIRLGWEANGTGFPWSILGQHEAYKACFRRQVGLLRQAAPNLQIDWTMRKTTATTVGIEEVYPGDDVVDLIGVNYYDRYPFLPDLAAWNKAHNAYEKGWPRGLGAWLDFAKSKGRKLSVSEWGTAVNNPFFIEKMHEFFAKNRSAVDYEAYFNCMTEGLFKIYPANFNPSSSSKYKSLWTIGG